MAVVVAEEEFAVELERVLVKVEREMEQWGEEGQIFVRMRMHQQDFCESGKAVLQYKCMVEDAETGMAAIASCKKGKSEDLYLVGGGIIDNND